MADVDKSVETEEVDQADEDQETTAQQEEATSPVSPELTDDEQQFLDWKRRNPNYTSQGLIDLMHKGYEAGQTANRMSEQERETQETAMFKEREEEADADEPVTRAEMKKQLAERDKELEAKEKAAQREWEHQEALKAADIDNPVLQQAAIDFANQTIKNNPNITVAQAHKMYQQALADQAAGKKSKQIAGQVAESSQVQAAAASSVPSGGGGGMSTSRARSKEPHEDDTPEEKWNGGDAYLDKVAARYGE